MSKQVCVTLEEDRVFIGVRSHRIILKTNKSMQKNVFVVTKLIVSGTQCVGMDHLHNNDLRFHYGAFTLAERESENFLLLLPQYKTQNFLGIHLKAVSPSLSRSVNGLFPSSIDSFVYRQCAM